MTRQRSEGSTIGMRIQSFDPSSVRKGGNFPIIKPLNVRMTSAVIRCWSHVFRRPMLDSQHSRPIPTFRLKNRRTFSQITINRNTDVIGKLAEGSDESVPMIGNRVQDSEQE